MTPEESEQLKHTNSACWNYILMQSNSDNQGKARCSVSGYFFLFTKTSSLPFPHNFTFLSVGKSHGEGKGNDTWFDSKQPYFMALSLASSFWLTVFPGRTHQFIRFNVIMLLADVDTPVLRLFTPLLRIVCYNHSQKLTQ